MLRVRRQGRDALTENLLRPALSEGTGWGCRRSAHHSFHHLQSLTLASLASPKQDPTPEVLIRSSSPFAAALLSKCLQAGYYVRFPGKTFCRIS
jgi:hypothetical protein